jgi:hypothetical protein
MRGDALGVHRGGFTSAIECQEGPHFQLCVLATLWLALALAPFAFSIQCDTRQIVRLSVAATEADWKAIPHFSDIERDADTKGGSTTSKTYQVLMIDGTPYSRLIAVNDEPLSPAEQARECERMRRVIAKRAGESASQRAKRLAEYQENRNRMFALMRGMIWAFDFKVTGEERLEGHNVYVLEATPRPGYQPNRRETKVLAGMRGRLWIDTDNYQWVKVEAEVLKPVVFGWFIAKVMPGTSFVVDQGFVAKGLWLPTHFRVEVKARVFWLPKGYIHDETYRDYRQISPLSTPKQAVENPSRCHPGEPQAMKDPCSCLSSRTAEILRCHENGSPAPKEEGVGGGGPTINHPWSLLSNEGNRGVIFMHSSEPKDHGIFAQNHSLEISSEAC